MDDEHLPSKNDVNQFLQDLKTKIEFNWLVFLDKRGKNTQALLDLEITRNQRVEVLKQLQVEDYCQGPIEDMEGRNPLWVFGKTVKGKEVYIKLQFGPRNAICIPFHVAEHKMHFPFQ